MKSAFSRLFEYTKNEGVRSTFDRIWSHLAWRGRELKVWLSHRKTFWEYKSWNPSYRLRVLIDRRFDRRYGVDTSGVISLARLNLEQAQAATGYHYEPTPVPALRSLLKALDIDHRKWTFVDYGSGKGRVLLLASEYPFKQILGVEFAEALHLIAEQNIRIWKNDNQKCHKINSLCADARDFDVPEGPVVLFFFTPFKRPISDEVIGKIRSSYRANPRPMRIVYYGTNKQFIDLLSGLGFSQSVIYSERPISALRGYRGLLFSANER